MYKYVELLEQYVYSNYEINNELINIKINHIVRVYKLMINLIEKLNLKDEDAVIALCIALFHDLGRFKEVKDNSKFDKNIDHASDSNVILFDEGFIHQFPIEEKDYELVRKAVYYHNNRRDSMRYLVKMSDLKEEIEYLERQLSVINDNINQLSSLYNDITWEGTGSESFFNHYDKYVSYLNSLEERIEAYINFLKSYYQGYGDKYTEFRSRYVNLLDEEV